MIRFSARRRQQLLAAGATAIVTDVATGNPNVKELVYIDAFAPDQGQTVESLVGPASVVANPGPTQVFSIVPAGTSRSTR
jgi:hypothetical protein